MAVYYIEAFKKNKNHIRRCGLNMVGEDGFEPSKASPADLQSVPFGRSGIPPYLICPFADWSWWTDSNPRPADYKSAALPTELHQHFASA